MKNTKKLLINCGLFVSIFFCSNGIVNAGQESNIRAGIVNTSGSNLNVRNGSSMSSTLVTKLKDNSYVTILNETNSFYYIEYNENKFGYVHKDYVTIKSTKNAYVNTNGYNLNVREGASTNYKVFEQIKDKDYVVILSSDTHWSKVLFEGNKIGYVSNAYLTSSYSYNHINLDIISYKQYDSRWSNSVVGNSGKTMKQIGCLTTSMAMIESYRTGKTITPLQMKNTSSYTQAGNLYWPTNYSFITSSTNYLNSIYNLLKLGKPVIIGCNSYSGNQHWVVVYAHNGSNSLNAKDFLIKDPGSSTRITLQDFINDYQKFYKIAYYN